VVEPVCKLYRGIFLRKNLQARNKNMPLILYCPCPETFGSHLMPLPTYGKYKLSSIFLLCFKKYKSIWNHNTKTTNYQPPSFLYKFSDIYKKKSCKNFKTVTLFPVCSWQNLIHMQEVKHIQFLEVSFNRAICALKLTVSIVYAEFSNAQADEVSKFYSVFQCTVQRKTNSTIKPHIPKYSARYIT
jgi:hypothetical protein